MDIVSYLSCILLSYNHHHLIASPGITSIECLNVILANKTSAKEVLEYENIIAISSTVFPCV